MKEVTKEVVENLIKEKDDLCISIYMPTRAAASSEVKKMPIPDFDTSFSKTPVK